jgi:hypothetical protein
MAKDEASNDPEGWNCIDCGYNTGPGMPTKGDLERAFKVEGRDKINAYINADTEAYYVKPSVWRAAKIGEDGGCLCIGCLEKRVGRKLKFRDFPDHPFNKMPRSARLMERRRPYWPR